MDKDNEGEKPQSEDSGQGIRRRRITFQKHQLKLDLEDSRYFLSVFNAVNQENGSNGSGERHREFYKMDDIDDCEDSDIQKISESFWHFFEKKNKLGEGTSAIVRKCIDKSTGKVYAVKIVRTRDEEIIFHVGLP